MQGAVTKVWEGIMGRKGAITSSRLEVQGGQGCQADQEAASALGWGHSLSCPPPPHAAEPTVATGSTRLIPLPTVIAELCPHYTSTRSQPPVPDNVTVFGSRIIADTIS